MMKNWSIQRRVLLIALLPAALLALVLSAWNAYQRIDAAERRAIEHARAIAAEISPIAGHVVRAAEDDALLEGLSDTLIAERSAVTDITIRDRADNVVLRAQGRDTRPSTSGDDGVQITRPIADPPATGTPVTTGRTAGSLGTVEVTVDLARARREQIPPLLEGLMLTAMALGLTALVAVRIGRGVTDPVHELVHGIERIRSGDHDYRPRVRSGGELGQLERGVHELTATIEATQRSLQRRIEEATRELQATLAQLEERNAELESARREAEAASEFKSRFLANISHEIRTPMNSILGFTELLERADLDAVHADYLVTIQSSAQSLLSLLNGILDLSKIESGHMELEYADTDVNGLLFETFNLLAPQAFAKGVEFVVKPAPARNSVVRVDAMRLKQVLINLASNAVKFTDRGHVRIAAEPVPRADGSFSMTFSFFDTGRGIPRDAQARLFQAFAQGEDMRGDERPRATGTGLGLHIASEIVFLMDGLIEFRSEPGAGSGFWFTLELDPAHAASTRAERAPRRRAMLVIDGDPDFIATHVDILAAAGIDAEPIPPGRSTSEWPDTSAADAILVHISAHDAYAGEMQPSGSGPAANTPVFAYIYVEDPGIHRQLLQGGFAGIIQKTPDAWVLRRSLERALEEQEQSAAPPPWQQQTDARFDADVEGKVLVVDDQPLNLKLIESFLEGTGWQTVAASGSDEALYHAHLTPFDAILMDIHLPERNGIETTAILRRSCELNAHTPILAITADAFAEQAHAAMAAGMNEVLVKPIRRTVLLERLSEWCHPREYGCDPPGSGRDDGTRSRVQPPCYDEEDARFRAGGRPGVADELFGMLCRHLPESRAELRSAHDRNDREALLSAAHRLKGAAAYCGVPRLRHDIAVLDACVRSGDDPASALDAVCATIDVLLGMGTSGTPEPHPDDA